MPIILTRHGKPDHGNVSPAEAKRVGQLVHDMAGTQGISLQIAHIITSNIPRTKQTAHWIAESNGIQIPTEGFPADSRIFDCYPVRSYSTSPEIQWAMILVRDKVAEIWKDIPLIIVGHLPSIWWLWSQLDPTNFPEFKTENDRDIDELIPYGSVIIVPAPN